MGAVHERIDQQLVRLGLVRSRSQAQALIAAGRVFTCRGTMREPVKRASMPAVPDQDIAMSVDALAEPVSRGAGKLSAMLARMPDVVSGAFCLDAGQSTGGFTECLLDHGACGVVGIEVGHGQLAARLRANARVACVERTHIERCTLPFLAQHAALSHWPMLTDRLAAGIGFDCVVADLSFIALRRVLPTLANLLADDGHLVALVKPQFELGRGAVDRRGIVTDTAGRAGLRNAFEQVCADNRLLLHDWIDSPIRGGDGNDEFLMHAQRCAAKVSLR